MADLNLITGKGETLLHLAVKSHYVEVIEALLDNERFELINQKKYEEQTVLDMICDAITSQHISSFSITKFYTKNVTKD